MMVVWAAIDTKDKYKRLCAVADTVEELARMQHVKPETIYEHRSKAKKGLLPEKYLRIELPDDEEEIQNLISSVELGRDYNISVPEEDWLAYQAAVKRRKEKEE